MITHFKSKRQKRKTRVRMKIHGSAKRPRLSIFRSNRYISAQLIDDTVGKTLVLMHSKSLITGGEFSAGADAGKKTEFARQVGSELAKKAKDLGIHHAVFDRSGYRYHGRVKALAEGAREGGLKI